ncbi:hypothetical protein HYU40_04145 [Candidatus Woesearchaeota archaeon]|nr:hypothetical protein [Candidatus Woesearchaeota archaeon]
MEYWHDLVTEKSWKLLQQLKGKFKFALIGGWAVYLLARAQKSKDIDIIVDMGTLQRIKNSYDLRKNDALRKYEIKVDEVDVDIYVPFYSRLAIPLEKIESIKIEGFDVARPEELLVLKQSAEMDRGHSEKGEKDRVDIMSLLLNSAVDFHRYKQVITENKKAELITRLLELVRGFNEYKYFNITLPEFKRRKLKLVDELRKL